MKKNAKFFRDEACQQLSGNWKHVVLFTLVYFLIVCVLNVIGIKSEILNLLLVLLVGTPLQYGCYVAYLGYIRTGKNIEVKDMFEGFKTNYGRVVLANLLVVLGVFFGLIVLIVPGVIFSLASSMSVYILKDNPELKSVEVIKRSIKMMKGHKMEYFCLMLSFFGWILVGILTLFIGFMWIIPYMSTAFAHFYEYVKEDYERSIEA